MATSVVGTNEFRDWYWSLDDNTRTRVAAAITLLEDYGTALGHPHSSAIKGTALPLRELRVQHMGEPYRVLYIFDPVRQAVLLVGGNKVGKGNRWYGPAIRLAERLYAEYLLEIGH